MTRLFRVKVEQLRKIHQLPDSWCEREYQDLLAQMEVDDVADLAEPDLLDVLIMALQDIGAEEAADLVLAQKLRNDVTRGSRENIIQDLLEGQRVWEEAADIFLHSRIFSACELLNRVFPRAFNRPDIMQLTLRIQATKAEAKRTLQSEPEAAFVTRLLADAMDEHSILERLFSKQLAGNSFPEAEGIVWKARYEKSDSVNQEEVLLSVFSSRHWLQAMEDIDQFESSAYIDSEDEPD